MFNPSGTEIVSSRFKSRLGSVSILTMLMAGALMAGSSYVLRKVYLAKADSSIRNTDTYVVQRSNTNGIEYFSHLIQAGVVNAYRCTNTTTSTTLADGFGLLYFVAALQDGSSIVSDPLAAPLNGFGFTNGWCVQHSVSTPNNFDCNSIRFGTAICNDYTSNSNANLNSLYSDSTTTASSTTCPMLIRPQVDVNTLDLTPSAEKVFVTGFTNATSRRTISTGTTTPIGRQMQAQLPPPSFFFLDAPKPICVLNVNGMRTAKPGGCIDVALKPSTDPFPPIPPPPGVDWVDRALWWTGADTIAPVLNTWLPTRPACLNPSLSPAQFGKSGSSYNLPQQQAAVRGPCVNTTDPGNTCTGFDLFVEPKCTMNAPTTVSFASGETVHCTNVTFKVGGWTATGDPDLGLSLTTDRVDQVQFTNPSFGYWNPNSTVSITSDTQNTSMSRQFCFTAAGSYSLDGYAKIRGPAGASMGLTNCTGPTIEAIPACSIATSPGNGTTVNVNSSPGTTSVTTTLTAWPSGTGVTSAQVVVNGTPTAGVTLSPNSGSHADSIWYYHGWQSFTGRVQDSAGTWTACANTHNIWVNAVPTCSVSASPTTVTMPATTTTISISSGPGSSPVTPSWVTSGNMIIDGVQWPLWYDGGTGLFYYSGAQTISADTNFACEVWGPGGYYRSPNVHVQFVVPPCTYPHEDAEGGFCGVDWTIWHGARNPSTCNVDAQIDCHGHDIWYEVPTATRQWPSTDCRIDHCFNGKQYATHSHPDCDAFADCSSHAHAPYCAPDQLSASNCGIRLSGCFAAETPMLLADGKRVNALYVKPGDMLWNPVLKRGFAVRKIVVGPEFLPFVSVKTDSGALQVTTAHPMITDRGLLPASLLRAGDRVLAPSGKFELVVERKDIRRKAAEDVYNFELETDSTAPNDHLIVGGGIVTGDLWLQTNLKDDFRP